MLAIQVDSNSYVAAFDVMTLADYQIKRYGQINWYFIDRTAFYDDAEVAAFMTSPQSYYIDDIGILRLDYQDSINDVSFAPFADMAQDFTYGTLDTTVPAPSS
jgi:1,4-alpha-glucan branching enzyme